MDAETCLINDLAAPVRSFRLFAIEQIIQTGGSEAVLQALLQQQKVEDDSECQLLLDHAVAKVRSRIQGEAGEAPQTGVTAETFAADYSGRNDQGRLELLARLPQNLLKPLAPQVPALFAAEKNRLIGAAMIRVFGRVWPRENLRDLVPHLRSTHLSVRTAVLEVFIKQAPDLLARDLPKLLISPEPRIRALAVRGLATIDPHEARNHLEALFDLPQIEAKVAALQNSIYFPFEQVRPLLLKLLALERDPEFLERIGMFLENNPDLEAPFRIWEIADQSPPEKRTLLLAIQKRACANIQNSGILQDRYPEYIRELEGWITKRAAKRWVQEMIERIEATEESPEELNVEVEKHLATTLLREAFEKALEWPIPEKVKARMRELLAGVSAPPVTAAVTAVVTAAPAPIPWSAPGTPPAAPSSPAAQPVETSFASLEQDEKVRLISQWGPDSAAVAIPHLETLLRNDETPVPLRSVAFKAATRMGLKAFIGIARKDIRSKSPQLASSSMEYLGAVDADWLLPFLGKFLNSDNIRLKGTALKLLQKTDPAQAISVQKAMLADKNPEQQKAALACMVHFDFKLVRDALLQFIATKPGDDLVERSLCFFKANPEQDNLYLLYKLEKTLSPTLAKVAREIRLENEKLLTDAGQIQARDPKIQEEQLASRFAEERARQARAPSPYSLKNIKEPTFKEAFADYLQDLRYQVSDKTPAELLRMGLNAVSRFGSRNPGLVAAALLAIIGFWIFLGWEASGPATATDRGAATLSQPITVIGTVRQAEKTGVLLQGKDGTTYAVAAPHDRDFSEVAVGTEVKMTLVPMRIGGDKVVKAQFIKAEAP